MLTAFVVAQLVFDVAVLALVATYLLGRKAEPAPAPPEWYPKLVALAQDLMAATEPVLERLEGRDVATPEPEPDRYGEAIALLRSGARPDEVAGRSRLHPGEMKLIASVVAAESRGAAAAASPRSGFRSA